MGVVHATHLRECGTTPSGSRRSPRQGFRIHCWHCIALGGELPSRTRHKPPLAAAGALPNGAARGARAPACCAEAALSIPFHSGPSPAPIACLVRGARLALTELLCHWGNRPLAWHHTLRSSAWPSAPQPHTHSPKPQPSATRATELGGVRARAHSSSSRGPARAETPAALARAAALMVAAALFTLRTPLFLVPGILCDYRPFWERSGGAPCAAPGNPPSRRDGALLRAWSEARKPHTPAIWRPGGDAPAHDSNSTGRLALLAYLWPQSVGARSAH